MALGIGMQLEPRLAREIVTRYGEMPWRMGRRRGRCWKLFKHRRERRRSRADPECAPEYRRFRGYEF